MNKYSRWVALLALCTLMPFGESAWATLDAQPFSSLSVAIDKAGRQRMLTQRIIKAYSQELLEVEPQQSQQQREQAIALLDQQLDELKQFAPTDKVRNALGVVDALWIPFKKRASSKVSRAGLESLSTSSDEVLAASHRVVLLLEDLSTNNLGHLVNIAGRQRMLSQRIAKLYMLRSLGISDDAVVMALDKASSEFRTALHELETAHENTPQISAELADVKRNWSVFESSFRLRDGNYTPFLIARYSERVLSGMNKITGMYAAINSGNTAY
ncbi:MAG TPA: type IV pili methyl-accepting chemotaxis transducer N-terminal domain-containing protein [Gammaproteobacteria bacterium]